MVVPVALSVKGPYVHDPAEGSEQSPHCLLASQYLEWKSVPQGHGSGDPPTKEEKIQKSWGEICEAT